MFPWVVRARRRARIPPLALLLLVACGEKPATAPPPPPTPVHLADSLQLQGADSAAAALFLQLRDSLLATRDTAWLWHSTIWGGYSLMHLGRRDSAGTLLRESLRLAMANRSRYQQAWSRSILSNWWDLQGELDSAFANATEARALAVASGNDTLIHSTSVSLGRIYKATARYRASLALHESTLTAEQALGPGHDLYIASDHNELCVDYRSLGRLPEAVASCQRGLALLEGTDITQRARLLLNLGVIYADVGDEQVAESLYLAALDVYRRKQDSRGLSIVHGDLGNIYLASHDDSLARREFALEDSIARAAGLTWGVLGAQLDLATVELEQHHPAEALRLANEALRLADSRGYSYERVNARIELSNAEVDLLRLPAAVRHARDAVRLADSLDVLELKVDAREALGSALRASHQQAALDAFYEELALLESWRGRLALGDLSAGLADLHLRPFEGAIALLIARHRPGEAFQVAERAKARILRHLMKERGIGAEAMSTRDSTIGRLRTAYLERADAAPDRQPALDGEIHRLLDSLTLLDQGRDRLLPPIGTASQDWSRQLLAPGQGLLGYFWGDSLVYGWWLGPDTIRVAELGQVDSLAPMLDFLHDALARPSSDSGWRPAALRVYQRLVAPLAPDSVAELFVIPDGPLGRIPFEALLPSAGAPPLGAGERIVYAPSASVLLSLAHPSDNGGWSRAILAVGNPLRERADGSAPVTEVAFRGAGDPRAPLPFGEEEARTIAGFYRSEGSDLLVGRAASLGRWRDLKPERYRYLHFATHAQVSELRPALTRVVLADTSLDLSAIEQLRLHAELVTLSGCETALGRRSRGEGVIGLSHAFLAAGARGVLVTLWPVEDREASEFMVSFYRALHDGTPPAQALVDVRRRWLAAGGPRADPHRWAAFVLVGGDRSLDYAPGGR